MSRSELLTLFFLTPVFALADEHSRQVQVYDILRKNCFGCHGPTKTSGLDLRTHQSILDGGTRGAAVVPRNLQRSPLYQFAVHESKPAMPPGQKLSDEDLDAIRQWILDGAGLDGVDEAVASNAAQAKAELAKLEERPIKPEERAFWAYQRPARAKPPRVAHPLWKENPIDAFLFAAMQSKGVNPSPRADRRTLIRRAYLDVLGLPPSPDEVEAFVNDTSADAWPRLVDKLLASPHYGERWARNWLDLVRYADSGGFEFDVDRPDAWRYRDYIVKSFNDDKPYDRFVKEQLAGDEYAEDARGAQDAMIATGFLRLGPEGGGGGERGRQDSLDDIVSTATLTFLGQTVGCARCHNHKFDPIPQKDYYRIQAAFFSTRPLSYPLVAPAVVDAHKKEMQHIDGLQRPLKKSKAALEEPYRKRLFDEWLSRLPEYMQSAWRTPEDKRTEGQKLNVRQIEKTLLADQLSGRISEKDAVALMTDDEKRRHLDLATQIAELEKERPKPYATARAVEESGREARTSYFLHRGSVDTKGSLMKPGGLSVVAERDYEFAPPPPNAKSSWGRRGLAEWIASRENPLTARVMVNRVWQHHFGEGIVRTPSNFGTTGDRPSHPELLDWLAAEFIDRGWSLKAMHRLMLHSEAYRMASNDIAANAAVDPENRLFWRMPRQRLDAETLRDAVLAAAGTLDRTMGGPCVYPYINPSLFQSSTRRTWPGKPDSDPSTWRRSLYVFSKRSIRYPMFETFDQPNLINSCDRRNRSTIAPQALLMMNNSLLVLQAKYFAQRVQLEAGREVRDQIDRAWRLALGRAPLESEQTRAAQFMKDNPDGLTDLCQALFNLNEFVYRQ
ncbi:MAG: PSD1 and planctomycete cytochrome C domain-containing protein [Bryobacteraceae bacterium]